MTTQPKHFLNLAEIDPADLRRILDTAVRLKRERAAGKGHGAPLAGRKLAMIFEQNSTRTRISFEVGMMELGGGAVVLNGHDMQLGRGETIADTARVMSRYVDAVMLRCLSHEKLQALASHADVPVINGLTNFSHPCQIMADILTFEERRGRIKGCTVAWVGDGNNVANSWIEAAAKFDFVLRIACPEALKPSEKALEWARSHGAKITLTDRPEQAAEGADAVVTDTWVSMGDSDSGRRMALLQPYQVTSALMSKAAKGAIFLHCLPAHRGEEVEAAVIDGPASAVWDEAENRLHIQKAILLWCINK